MFFKLWCCQLVRGWLWRSGATILLKVGSSFSAYWARNDIKLKIFRFVFVIMLTFAGLVVVSTFRSWSSFDSTANQLKPNQPWIPVRKSEWMGLGLRSQIGVRVAIHIMVSDFFTALALCNWQALVWWVNINFFFPNLFSLSYIVFDCAVSECNVSFIIWLTILVGILHRTWERSKLATILDHVVLHLQELCVTLLWQFQNRLLLVILSEPPWYPHRLCFNLVINFQPWWENTPKASVFYSFMV